MVRVLCALSGGVDSSVAAWLLQQAGHDVIGVFMRNGVAGDGIASEKSCCSASDARDASRVADMLGIPFYAVDYEGEFRGLIDHFKSEYRAGRTPSPCVLCNQDLKFGHLFELADSVGAEWIATGHYARIEDGRISRPRDLAKDQTYFLFGIERAVLPRLRFPLGDLDKDRVREIARTAGFPTASKPESMEICFVPTGDYRDVLRGDGPLTPGRFVDPNGVELGVHEGFEAFTVGQRRGLPALGSKRYVLEVRPETAEVVVGSKADLATRELRISGVRWLVDPPEPDAELRCAVQIRARHRAASAVARVDDSGELHVVFDVPQEAVTPGQAGVLYDADALLGGGWIETRWSV